MNQRKTIIMFKKIKTLLLISGIIDILQVLPLLLALFSAEMKTFFMEDAVKGSSQNPVASEVFSTFIFVFAFLGLAYIACVFIARSFNNIEVLQKSALLLAILHLAWTLPDFVSIVLNKPHAPLPVMIISLVPVAALFYGWKGGEL